MIKMNKMVKTGKMIEMKIEAKGPIWLKNPKKPIFPKRRNGQNGKETKIAETVKLIKVAKVAGKSKTVEWLK